MSRVDFLSAAKCEMDFFSVQERQRRFSTLEAKDEIGCAKGAAVSYSHSSKMSASACHPEQGGDLSLGVFAGGPATGSREVRDAGAGHTSAGMIMLVARGTRGRRKEKRQIKMRWVSVARRNNNHGRPIIIRYDYVCWSEQSCGVPVGK